MPIWASNRFASLRNNVCISRLSFSKRACDLVLFTIVWLASPEKERIIPNGSFKNDNNQVSKFHVND